MEPDGYRQSGTAVLPLDADGRADMKPPAAGSLHNFERPPLPLDSDGRLNVNIACINCGYNLRTLEPAGVCPECGAPVMPAVREQALRFTSVRWITHCAEGAATILATFRLSLAMLALFVALVGLALLIDNQTMLVALPFMLIPAWVMVGVLTLIGTLGMTSRDPRQPPSRRRMDTRRSLRRLPLMAVLLFVVMVASTPLIVVMGNPVVPACIACVWYAVVVIAPPVLLLRYVRQLVGGISAWVDHATGPLIYSYVIYTIVLPAAGIPWVAAYYMQESPLYLVVAGVLVALLVTWLTGMAMLFRRVVDILNRVRDDAGIEPPNPAPHHIQDNAGQPA